MNPDKQVKITLPTLFGIIRKHKGYSLSKVSDLLNVHVNSVSMMEKREGPKGPRSETIQSYAEVLGMSVDVLMRMQYDSFVLTHKLVCMNGQISREFEVVFLHDE